jgi:5'-3' exonuclease
LKLLTDSDLIVYRAGWACNKLDFISNVDALENILYKIESKFENPEIINVLSGTNNFRLKISDTYKSNRKPENRPKYYSELREYLIYQKGSIIAEGEADDYIGCNNTEDTVIVSIDKDLLQLGGTFYNFVKDEHFKIDPNESHFYFYKQMLMGDSADCVDGLTGIGDVKSTKLITGKSKQEMKEIVQSKYKDEFGDNWFEFYDRNARLLFIKRTPTSEYYDYF